MKDNFSKQSHLYAKFRPTYPKDLFDFLVSLTPAQTTAWDCGTGNGQVAVELAAYFNDVFATDISEQQLQNATARDNIVYRIEAAEHSTFTDNMFDLITVAQAVHWFDFKKFYNEINRTLKPNGILAILGYPLPTIDGKIDPILDHFYRNILRSYWDDERKYIDERYLTIPFPFKEIKAPSFSTNYHWDFEHFIGFLNTWSAVQHYRERTNENPIDKIIIDLKKCWGNNLAKSITFSMLLRVGVKTGA